MRARLFSALLALPFAIFADLAAAAPPAATPPPVGVIPYAWTAPQFFTPTSNLLTYTLSFANGVRSFTGAHAIEGLSSDSSTSALLLYNSGGKPEFNFEDDSRLDTVGYNTAVDPTYTATNYGASAYNEVAGHYAGVALESAGNPNTVAYTLYKYRGQAGDNTATAMYSAIQQCFMAGQSDGGSGAYSYQNPNSCVTFSANGIDLPSSSGSNPSFPITNVSGLGVVDVNNAIYANSGGNVCIGCSAFATTTPSKPLQVNVASGYDLIVLNQSTTVGLAAENDTFGSYEPMDIDSSSLCINCNTNNQITFGTALTIFKGTIDIQGSAPSNSGTCSIGSQSGGNTAGKFSLSSACSSGGTIVLAISKASGHGFSCWANDETTPTTHIGETASTTSSVTFTAPSGGVASGDAVDFGCIGY